MSITFLNVSKNALLAGINLNNLMTDYFKRANF
jgi:hypothetical protein